MQLLEDMNQPVADWESQLRAQADGGGALIAMLDQTRAEVAALATGATNVQAYVVAPLSPVSLEALAEMIDALSLNRCPACGHTKGYR